MTDTLSAGRGAAADPPGEGSGAGPAPAHNAAGSDSDPDGAESSGRTDHQGPLIGPPAPLADARCPASGCGAARTAGIGGVGGIGGSAHRPATPREAAVWYADVLGWPVTPALERLGGPAASRGAGSEAAQAVKTVQAAQTARASETSRAAQAGKASQAAETNVPRVPALGPGPWLWAASATPRLVEAVWHRCPNAPILLVLGREVPGAAKLGAVDVPALVGAAALERLGRVPAAAGPVADGQGRIRFLVDLGTDGGDCAFERWREAGVDLRVRGPGEFCPVPTPGARGPASVVWAVPPDPDRAALPPAHLVTEVLDRAVRDAYPALWNAIAEN